MKTSLSILVVLVFISGVQAQNVGIGTPDPISQLHVKATALGTAIFESSHGTGTWASIKNTSAGGQEWSLISTGTNNGEGAGHLLFYRAGARVIMHQNGNVGIGTTNPGYKLDVVGNSRFTGDQIVTSNNVGGTWFYLTNSNATPTGWKLIAMPSTSSSPGAFTMFNDQNQAHFTLQQGGNMGLGTFNPQVRLHISADMADLGMLESTNGLGTWTHFRNTSPGGTTWSLISTGQANGEGAGHLLFYNAGNVRLTLQQGGNVGVGVNDPIHRLDIGGDIRVRGGSYYFGDRYFQTLMYNNGGNPNGICITPHTNNFGALGASTLYWNKGFITEIFYSVMTDISDARAKKNIEPLGTMLDKIVKLQPVRYDINPETHPGYKNAKPGEIERAKGTMGFTAQNIKEVFPSMVVYNEELGVNTIRNYNQLLSVLVQGMKEQQEIITRLEARIKVLER